MKLVVSNTEAETRIRNEEPFRTAFSKPPYVPVKVPRLSGGPSAEGSYGFLPKKLRADVDRARYVVKSYETPIAWIREDGTTCVPDIGYSPTTGEHQYMVKAAWKLRGFPARGRQVVQINEHGDSRPRQGGFGSCSW